MSFLRDFMIWNEGTEVPEQYYFWSGITALAAIVNGRVWIKMGRYEIFPNLYVVLLGPPANGKTSAMRRAEKVVRRFEDIPVSAQSETPEGLIRFMREGCVQTITINNETVVHTPITCFLPELSNFFAKDAAGMVDVLTGIWDCAGENFHRRTKSQGADMLPRPSVNLIGCTTQDWITNYMKADIVGGGFSRRVIYVNELMTDDTKRVPWPETTEEQNAAFERCITYGQQVRSLAGEMQYGEGARAWWDNWYRTRPISRDSDVRGFHKSKPAILLKIATLVALSERPELRVTVDDFEIALALIDKTEVHLHKVFQSIGRNELNQIAQKALSWIETFPEVEYRAADGTTKKAKFMDLKKLQGMLFKDAGGRDTQEILNHLQTTDKIFYYVQTGTNRTLVGLK